MKEEMADQPKWRKTEEKVQDNEEKHKEEITEDDFTCSCCYEILLDPTTLACGHTFCRFCLANWLSTSRKTECLQCRRPFAEFPKINFTLRNTLERLFPDEVAEKRATQESLPNYGSIIAAFDKHAESSQSNRRSAINHFSCGRLFLFLSIIIAVIVLITLGWRQLVGGPDVLLDSKIVTEWTPDDVAYWVGEQGVWAKGVYDKRFKEAGIDGNLLLRISEEDLMGTPINMHLRLHRRVFMDALAKVQLRKKERPGDFWEFKAANRAKALFLQIGIREFPRTMFLYLYVFDYHEIFLPFLQDTCAIEKIASWDDKDPGSKIQPSWEQWHSFILWAMTSPYYMIAYFASQYLAINYWISRIVIVHAVAMGCLELTYIGWIITGGYKTLPGLMLKNLIYVLGISLLLKIFWPFIPFFICDIMFWWMLVISPFDAVNRLCRRLNSIRNAPVNREVQQNNPGWQFAFRFGRE
ncbi:bifunctional apoptosis regulator-like [Rhopilema esculentum]|uniref:bifunctional apoptosis regulator-like n=1 Tax=Rhopilema esculentum TaxID=499914 RepID=UPI0031E33A3A|eukprot:gene9114-16773_t